MVFRFLLCLVVFQPFFCSAWLFKRKCYREMFKDFQCYSLKYPYWNTLFHYPKSPSEQNIHFKLFTPQTASTPRLLDALNATKNKDWKLDVNGKVAFVIHGFTDSSTKSWVLDMVEALLEVVPNVIAADWEKGAKGPNYYRAAANTRVVGAQLATLIKTLRVDPGKIHLIGHSLGAHVAGYAGEKFGQASFVRKKIGRITGLDPAAPLFADFSENVRLDRSDATFVDIIHTDAPLLMGGAGMKEKVGHVDFFPNGGSRMPGCGHKVVSLLKIKNLKNNLSCSHRRAVDYFTASINDNTFTAYPCASRLLWRACRRRRCGGRGCNRMGYHASSKPAGLFILRTSASYPF